MKTKKAIIESIQYIKEKYLIGNMYVSIENYYFLKSFSESFHFKDAIILKSVVIRSVAFYKNDYIRFFNSISYYDCDIEILTDDERIIKKIF